MCVYVCVCVCVVVVVEGIKTDWICSFASQPRKRLQLTLRQILSEYQTWQLIPFNIAQNCKRHNIKEWCAFDIISSWETLENEDCLLAAGETHYLIYLYQRN